MAGLTYGLQHLGERAPVTMRV